MKLFTAICLMIILISCTGPGPYGPGPYGGAVEPAMSSPQLPISYQRKCYDCLPRRQDANPI